LTPFLISAANPGPLTGAGNNTWFIDGAEPTLVDAGVGAPEHLDVLTQALAGRRLVRLLVTHGHPDHAAGIPAIRARWPQVDVCRWRDAGAANHADEHHIEDDARIRAGDEELLAIHTPGHAADHLCFFSERTGDLYAGDMLIAGTTVMIPAGKGGSLRAYLASLDRLARLAPRRVLPGHGPIIERPLELIREYLAHRQLREKQILGCLEAGVTTVEAIVSRVYPDLPDGVRPAARLTVQAHLDKLKEEGRWT
jgi:glyoxylase-like metal-dependent hydrolase (beta-lactamase superfamily II)